MKQATLLSILVLLPATASADAIMPFEGECFPGSRRGISNHAEACIPLECQADGDCGEGARCATLCTCRAEREFRGEGRVIYPEPVTRVVEIGFCDASGACAEGNVAERRQCEPVADTPAFDRRLHRWTGRPHASAPPAPPTAAPSDEPADEASSGGTSEADEEGGGGCAASPRAPVGGGLALGLLGLALSGIRRRRR